MLKCSGYFNQCKQKYFSKKTSNLKKNYKIKNSKIRHTVALCLNNWRKTHSIETTSKSLKINLTYARRLLCFSEKYKNSKHRHQHYNQHLINIKQSHFRNRLALILKKWKKLRSVKQVSKVLNLNSGTISQSLNKIKTFKKRVKYSRKDQDYASKWAKKIYAINYMGKKCFVCGTDDIFSLEFHHPHKNKERTISSLIYKNRTTKIKFKRELQKCKLLCKNCHQEIHHANPLNKRIKKELLRAGNSTKCQECGYSKNNACLIFHHDTNSNKQFNISRYSSYISNKNKMKVLNEIKKCTILCCNCHSKKQINLKRFKKLKLLISIKSRLLKYDHLCNC